MLAEISRRWPRLPTADGSGFLSRLISLQNSRRVFPWRKSVTSMVLNLSQH